MSDDNIDNNAPPEGGTQTILDTGGTGGTPTPPEGADLNIIDHHIPDALLNNPTVQRFKGKQVGDMLNAYVELRNMEGKRVSIPGEGASAEDLKAFHMKLGMPENSSDYKFPEGIKDVDGSEPNDTIKQSFAELAHAAHLSQDQLDVVYQKYYELANTSTEAMQQEEQLAFDKTMETLKGEWRGETDARISKANETAKLIFGDNYDEFNDLMGNNPNVIKRLFEFSKSMSGDSIQGTIPMQTGNDGKSLEEQLDAIIAHPDYNVYGKNADLQRQAQALSTQIMAKRRKESGRY